MKNIYTIILVLIGFTLSAEDIFFKTVGVKGWYSIDDQPRTGPNPNGVGNNYFVQEDGYVLGSGIRGFVSNFSVSSGITVTINGQLWVLNQFTLESNGNSSFIGVTIGPNNAEVWFMSNVDKPIFGSSIAYSDNTSLIRLTSAPVNFDRLDPGARSPYLGIVDFNGTGQTYTVGSLNIVDGLSYLITASSIAIHGNLNVKSNETLNGTSLSIVGKVVVSNSSELKITSANLIITGDVEITDNSQIVLLGNGLFISGTTTVEPGSILNGKGYTGTLSALDLLSDASGQGILIGTGFSCANVTSRVYVHSTTTGDGDATAYREIGIPFNKTVNDVSWGTFDANIKGSDSKYRHSFDNSTGLFTNGEPGDNVMSPQEVWLAGGSDVITVTGGNLSDRHNVGYSQVLYNVSDANNKYGFNMLYNPSLAAYNIKNLVDNYSGVGAIIKNAAWVMTEGINQEYKYFNIKAEYVDSRVVKTISPYQAFWVEYLASGTIDLTSQYQSIGIDQTLRKKNDNPFDLNNNVQLELLSDEGDNVFIDNVRLFYFDGASGIGSSLGANDVQNIRSGVANANPSIYMNIDSKRLIHKEYTPSEITSNTFTQGVSIVGGESKNLMIKLSNNDLGSNYNIYLIDHQEGITTKLNDLSYSFTSTARTSKDDFPDTDRFEVQITTETLGESERVEASSIKLANKGNSIEFMMPSTSSIESVQFVSLNGQVVKTVQATNGQTEFDVAELNSGIYIAQLKLASGNVASYKFVK